MIKKEDIKVGLEFVLPFRDFYDDEEKAEFYNRLISDNEEWHSHKYYTDMCLVGENDTVVTEHRPILRVLSITEYANITGKFDVVTVKNVNKCNVDAFCRQIDSSFIEEYGEAVMSKKKFNGVLYSCIDDFFCDNYPLFKCSQIDNVFCQEIPKSNCYQNTIIVGGSRSDNKRNLMNSWYHGKIRMSGYENNVEQSNESANRNANESANRNANESANRNANRKTDADRFKEITDKMCDIYKQKNSDYGSSFSKLFKKCGMTYAYGHLAEKIERIDSLSNNDAKVQGESMIDSLYDLANYSILTIMEIEKRKKHGTE